METTKGCKLNQSELASMTAVERAWTVLRHKQSGSCEEDEAQLWIQDILHDISCKTTGDCRCDGLIPWVTSCQGEGECVYGCVNDDDNSLTIMLFRDVASAMEELQGGIPVVRRLGEARRFA